MQVVQQADQTFPYPVEKPLGLSAPSTVEAEGQQLNECGGCTSLARARLSVCGGGREGISGMRSIIATVSLQVPIAEYEAQYALSRL
jgi:hypothetical protein